MFLIHLPSVVTIIAVKGPRKAGKALERLYLPSKLAKRNLPTLNVVTTRANKASERLDLPPNINNFPLPRTPPPLSLLALHETYNWGRKAESGKRKVERYGKRSR
jgi:hypothetical protein